MDMPVDPVVSVLEPGGVAINQPMTLLSESHTRLFVYGTLKRGHRLHSHLAGQTCLGEGQTTVGFRLLKCGWYPALVESEPGLAIRGEVWEVDDETLQRLDVVEEVSSGLYERRQISLQPPFDDAPAIAYLYLQDVAGLPDCGDQWSLTSPDSDPASGD